MRTYKTRCGALCNVIMCLFQSALGIHISTKNQQNRMTYEEKDMGHSIHGVS